MTNWLSSPMGLSLLAGITAFILFYGVYLSIEAAAQRQRVRERFLNLDSSLSPDGENLSMVQNLQNVFDHSPLGQRFAHILHDASISWSIAYLLLAALATFIVFLAAIAFLMNLSVHLNLLSSFVATVAALFFYFKNRRGLRGRILQKQSWQIATALANSLRAGLSIYQAFQEAAEKQPSPANEEFRKIVQRIDNGQSLEAALNNFAQENPSKEIHNLTTAISIQNEMGGDLARTLTIMSSDLLDEQKLQDECRSTTAEARFSSLVVVALSVIVLAIINLALGGALSEFIREVHWQLIGLDSLDRTPITLGFFIFFIVYVIPQVFAFVLVRHFGNVQI